MSYAPWSVPACKTQENDIKIMTFNLCRARENARNTQCLSELWPARKGQTQKLIASEHPDIICLQEFRDTVLTTMDDFFNFSPKYEHHIFAPNPDPIALRVAIAWDPRRVFPICVEKRWLCENDGRMPSRGADPDGKGKIIGGIQFVRVQDGSYIEGVLEKPFWVFCTHFSVNEEAKNIQAAAAQRVVRGLAGEAPAVLCGDMNFFDRFGGRKQRASLVGDYFEDPFADPSRVSIAHDGHPDDEENMKMDTAQYKILGTFFGMDSDSVKGEIGVGTANSRLDHILVSKNISYRSPTMVCRTMLPYPSQLFSRRNYPSDHFPLTLSIIL